MPVGLRFEARSGARTIGGAVSRPRIAVAPDSAPDWIREAVVEAGGDVVAVDEAEALVWTDPRTADPLAELLAGNEAIRWVQLPWAGVENFAGLRLFDDGRQWTCGKGVYAEEVAEHALALALAGLRDLHIRVVATSWGRQSGESLLGAPLTILGGGGITRSLIRLLTPFECDITVVRRSPEPVPGAARTVTADSLHDHLGGARLVVLALALTPETERIIDEEALRAMAADAWLVNVARGRHVDTDALVQALKEGWIAGAGLDVTDPEPLPDGHPLWELPNCIVTPHTANTAEMARPVLSARIRENVRRYAAGEELIGPVDPAAGY